MELISPIPLLKEGWKLSSTTKHFQNLTEEDGGRGEGKHEHTFNPHLLLHRDRDINLGHHRDAVGNIRVLKRC